MKSVYQEIIDEGNQILTKGMGHLRRRTREHLPLSPVKDYEPHEIKAIRENNQFSQAYFGEFLGVSLKTIQAWEAGTNKPTGTALRLFQILEQDPKALDRYLLAEA